MEGLPILKTEQTELAMGPRAGGGLHDACLAGFYHCCGPLTAVSPHSSLSKQEAHLCYPSLFSVCGGWADMLPLGFYMDVLHGFVFGYDGDNCASNGD